MLRFFIRIFLDHESLWVSDCYTDNDDCLRAVNFSTKVAAASDFYNSILLHSRRTSQARTQSMVVDPVKPGTMRGDHH